MFVFFYKVRNHNIRFSSDTLTVKTVGTCYGRIMNLDLCVCVKATIVYIVEATLNGKAGAYTSYDTFVARFPNKSKVSI